MKYLASLLFVTLLATTVAQEHTSPGHSHATTLMSGLGDLHHPVSTSNPQAQQFFDQGLRLIYAFNHDEAARSFRRAAELDPKLAVAYWGIAEAVGPNYNDPASDDRFKEAHDAIQNAVDLSASASPSERDYINAMAKRFPAEPNSDRRKSAEQYRDAMREVVKKYPDDLDAATLFAESGMDLHPWGLWHHGGTPEVGTDEIISTLESVIRRDPTHLGALHYYIHAVEASPNPERALAGANRLASLAPAAGHIVHMPAHIYARIGDYDSAVKTNEEAAAADRAYIKASGVRGLYPMMYYSHNLHFIAACSAMKGDYLEAKKNADMLAAHVGPHIKDMPPLEGFMTVPLAVDVRFHKWNEILAKPQPDPAMKTATTYWHFARGMAFAGTGRVSDAETEYKAVAQAEQNTAPDVIFAMPVNNKAKDIMKIAENVLGAKIASAKKDTDNTVSMLREAVIIQDSLNYDEPPDWFSPVRESLGAVLLMNGNTAEAEKVFREDLDRNPRNPRSLFGLQEALKSEGQTYDADFVGRQFRTSWKGAGTQLKIQDLV